MIKSVQYIYENVGADKQNFLSLFYIYGQNMYVVSSEHLLQPMQIYGNIGSDTAHLKDDLYIFGNVV